jgi:hypothetical protein
VPPSTLKKTVKHVIDASAGSIVLTIAAGKVLTIVQLVSDPRVNDTRDVFRTKVKMNHV